MAEVKTMYDSTAHYFGMLSAVRSKIRDNISSCADIALDQGTFCTRYQYGYIRSICPETCGCTSPWKGNMLAMSAHGCPGSCTSSYIAALQGLNGATPKDFRRYTAWCEDIPITALLADPSKAWA